MNFFDIGIINFLNQFSQDSWVFDKAVGMVEKNGLLKGGALMALVWYAWFRSGGEKDRANIVSTLIASLFAMATARVLASVLPFRSRPLHDDELEFQLPHGLVGGTLDGWSSFPSDHAVLFFTLSIGLLFVSKVMGVVAVLYTLVVIGMPRMYLGLHYPTDILAGALLGAAFTVSANLYLVRTRTVGAIVGLSGTAPAAPGKPARESASLSAPGLFYPLFFLFSYQVADMFSATRTLMRAFGTLMQGIS